MEPPENARRVRQMKTKTLGVLIAAVMTITGLTVTGSAIFTMTEVGGIEATWRSFEDDASKKTAILNALRNDKGFVALFGSSTSRRLNAAARSSNSASMDRNALR